MADETLPYQANIDYGLIDGRDVGLPEDQVVDTLIVELPFPQAKQMIEDLEHVLRKDTEMCRNLQEHQANGRLRMMLDCLKAWSDR